MRLLELPLNQEPDGILKTEQKLKHLAHLLRIHSND